MYEQLSEIYDAMYHFKDYGKECPLVVEQIRSHCPNAQTALEVACGTGLYLEQLRRHFKVEGVDLSPGMLRKATARLPDVPLHLGNMIDFDLGRQFDVVCILFRSIAFAKTKANFCAAVQTMARHVAPGGILLIEPFFTPETYWVDRVTLNEYNERDLKIAWMYVSERAGLVARQLNHVLVGRPSGVRHFTELHELGLFTREDYEQAFDLAQLSLSYDAHGPSGIGMYVGRKQ